MLLGLFELLIQGSWPKEVRRPNTCLETHGQQVLLLTETPFDEPVAGLATVQDW